tara:strand:+ start:1581 stop:1700 length:120 start_codon:yes stop_codon:yes gene_type:complete
MADTYSKGMITSDTPGNKYTGVQPKESKEVKEDKKEDNG